MTRPLRRNGVPERGAAARSDRSLRATAFAGGLALLAVSAPGCAPSRGPTVALPAAPTLEPAATPTPLAPVVDRLGDPGAEPTPPAHDPTRSPLTSELHPNAPPSVASALQMGDLARRELDAGTTVRAFELLDTAIQMEPELMELYVVRAQAYLAEGSTDRARADLERASELQPDAPWLAEIIAASGSAYEIEGRMDAALVAYRRALRVYPANRTARDALRRLAEQ
jgi:hypothetical protein